MRTNASLCGRATCARSRNDIRADGSISALLAFAMILVMIYVSSVAIFSEDRGNQRENLSPDWPFDVNYTDDVGYDPQIVDHVRSNVLIKTDLSRIGSAKSKEDYSVFNFTSTWLVPKLFEGIVVRSTMKT